MSRHKLIHLAYFVFVALLAASIPVSRYMISVFQFCLAGIFILEGIRYETIRSFYHKNTKATIILRFIPFHLWMMIDGIISQLKRIIKNRFFLIFLLYGLVYLIGLIYTSDISDALKILRKQLPILLLPLFFSAISSFDKEKKQVVLLFFVLSASVSSFISLAIFLSGNYDDIRRISPFISHIHLAVFIDYAIFILFSFYRNGIVKQPLKIAALLLILWLIVFQIIILKSLTGVVILFLCIYIILCFPGIFQLYIRRAIRFTFIFILPAAILSVIVFSILRFYNVDQIEPEKLEHLTAKGNVYHHDLTNRMLENGHYVFIYMAEKELREEWNKLSNYNYDSLDDKGQLLKYTLIRYLTSLGLRKDAEGMNQLVDSDIRMVEKGFANHIFSKKLSLYPRIYQVIWELDVYFKSGNPSGHSVTQRLESLKMGIQIASKHPVFGIGTGGLVAAYQKQYDVSESHLQKNARITGANQFLNFIVSFGVIGFIIILFAWLYPAIKSKAFKNPLFAMFFFISIMAMFSEEMLKFQTGITFFIFFYGFHIFLNNSMKNNQQ